MKKIKYTPDASDRLHEINRSILSQYGSKKAKEILCTITGAIRDLGINEYKGPTVESMFKCSQTNRRQRELNLPAAIAGYLL